jgi:hypothetical protein
MFEGGLSYIFYSRFNMSSLIRMGAIFTVNVCMKKRILTLTRSVCVKIVPPGKRRPIPSKAHHLCREIGPKNIAVGGEN